MPVPRGSANLDRPPAARPAVTLIGNFLSDSGGSRGVSEELAGRLRDAGWRVRTASRERGRFLRLLDMTGAACRGRDRSEVFHVDVFSGQAFLWAAAVVGILRLRRTPYALTLRGGGLPEFASRWSGAVRTVLRGARAVTVPSEFLRREMQPYRSDLLLLSNPLDIGSYPFRERRHPDPHVVWLRAFDGTYNPTLAPRAFADLIRDFPEATLTMIGPDKGDGSLARTRTQARDLGLADRIRFVGGIPKTAVGAHISPFDIFLNTTNVDNAPVTVLEALACGLCVVSTNVGGMPDFVRDGEEALLVPPDDPGAMAAAIRRILQEPGLAGKLSRNGRAKVEALDWSAVLPRWEAILTAGAGAGG